MLLLKVKSLVLIDSNDTEAHKLHSSLNRTAATPLSSFKCSLLNQSRYVNAMIFASQSYISSYLDLEHLAKVHTALIPGGTLLVFYVHAVATPSDFILKALLYGGFLNPSIVKESSEMTQITAQRPPWIMSSVKTCSSEDVPSTSSLIDEVSLVNQEDYVPFGEQKTDCSTKTRSCTNCTCGRKELEAQYGAEEAKRRLENATVRSSCGNCYLGDAFRCSSCPYRGQPAFMPNRDTVILDNTMTDLPTLQ